MKYHKTLKILLAGFIIAGYLLSQSCSVSRQSGVSAGHSAWNRLSYLASDALSGRLPGSLGDSLARCYIQQELRGRQVDLLFNDGFQEVTFTQARFTGENTMLVVDGRTFTRGKDIALYPFSSADTVLAQAVFAGYGITQAGDSVDWNDYAGIDVHNKWVIMLPGFPQTEGSGGIHKKYWEELDKAMLARDNGAAGVLIVSGINNHSEDHLVQFDSLEASIGIPVFQITRTVADILLEGKGITVSLLESGMVETKKPFSFAMDDSLYAVSDIRLRKGKTYNIAGIVEGYDPRLKNEFIVIGAHYDHLGTGGRNRSSRMPDTLAVHNGADDNASGVTVLLSLAERMNREKIRFRRSIIFAAFGAEEIGLLGSRHFIASPPVDLQKVVAMINLDMVGRLDTARGLQISGTGTSLEADSLIRLANQITNIRLRMSPEGFGPSDHASFYGKDIPVFFLTTGAHEDYHTPFDDVESINFQGLSQITGFAFSLTEKIADHAPGLHFREAGPKTSTSAARRFKVTLGFMPDFADETTDGVRVEFVTKGKPADLGGIKKGDIITSMNGLAVHNIYDYMYRLSKLSPGETVSVEILRIGRKEVLIIQL